MKAISDIPLQTPLAAPQLSFGSLPAAKINKSLAPLQLPYPQAFGSQHAPRRLIQEHADAGGEINHLV